MKTGLQWVPGLCLQRSGPEAGLPVGSPVDVCRGRVRSAPAGQSSPTSLLRSALGTLLFMLITCMRNSGRINFHLETKSELNRSSEGLWKMWDPLADKPRFWNYRRLWFVGGKLLPSLAGLR